MHRIYLETGPESGLAGGTPYLGQPGDRIVVTGEEARHAAKVKRIGVGEMVEVLNGQGLVAQGTVKRAGPEAGVRGRDSGWVVEIEIAAVVPTARVRPRVEVWSATPKGGRVDELIDGLSQVGAATWVPITTERGVVSPRESKLGRLERVAWEAAKQCGRPWVLGIEQERAFEEALRGGEGVSVVLAEGSSAPYQSTGDEIVRILIGPEGGWSESELRLAQEIGVGMARFGPHIMRIETAAVVAAAIVLDHEGQRGRLPTQLERE